MRAISIEPATSFKRAFKRLCKRYRSLPDDVRSLVQSLRNDPLQGVDLGNGLRKVRMAISSKNKGKSGGARVITYAVLLEKEGRLTLLTLYDKSEQETISQQELTALLEGLET